MGKPMSVDLRERVVAAVDGGMSRRKAAARTVDQLWAIIGASLDAFTPAECANYFVAAGYDAD